MATLMEKDVLIELSAATRVRMSKYEDTEEKIKDRNQNRYFYEALLKCPAEIFNFKIMAEKIMELYKKYE